MPQGKSGKLRILAVTSPKRVPQWPDLPTMAEASGIAGFSSGSWQGLVMPAKVNPAMVQRVAGEARKALAATEVRERYAALGTETVAGSSAEFGRWLADEHTRWSAVAGRAKLKIAF